MWAWEGRAREGRAQEGERPGVVSDCSVRSRPLQRCCHCCLLGRAAQAQGQSCEYSLMVGYQCGLVFRACCVKGQETPDFAPSDNGHLQDPGNNAPALASGQCVSQGHPEEQPGACEHVEEREGETDSCAGLPPAVVGTGGVSAGWARRQAPER